MLELKKTAIAVALVIVLAATILISARPVNTGDRFKWNMIDEPELVQLIASGRFAISVPNATTSYQDEWAMLTLNGAGEFLYAFTNAFANVPLVWATYAEDPGNPPAAIDILSYQDATTTNVLITGEPNAKANILIKGRRL